MGISLLFDGSSQYAQTRTNKKSFWARRPPFLIPICLINLKRKVSAVRYLLCHIFFLLFIFLLPGGIAFQGAGVGITQGQSTCSQEIARLPLCMSGCRCVHPTAAVCVLCASWCRCVLCASCVCPVCVLCLVQYRNWPPVVKKSLVQHRNWLL